MTTHASLVRPRPTPAADSMNAVLLLTATPTETTARKLARPLLARAITDSMFGDSTRRLAQAHRADPRGTTHAYTFGWCPAAFDGQLGACHCIELPWCSSPPTSPASTAPSPCSVPVALATTVHDALVGFIRNSAPAGPRTRRTPHVQTLGGDCVAPKTREG